MVQTSKAYLEVSKEKIATVIGDRTNATAEYDNDQACIVIKTGRLEHDCAWLYDYEFTNGQRGTELEYATNLPIEEKGGRKVREAVSDFVVDE